ncbi:MAG: sugar phosphate isomerase/epimerase [Clostridia bacterium]|nr:sugar phosphate isomerase/epimerase [Clostridia bacterium]
MNYGLQLYSVRDITEKDFEKALKQVAEMGYTLVESAGFLGHKAEDVKAMLEHYGLTLCSTHTDFQQTFERFDKILDYHKKVGCSNLILPSTLLATKEGLDYSIACINRFQPILESEGIRLHYHNHHREFLPNRDGLIPIEEMAKRTNVNFELDTFWVFEAGLSPTEVMDRYRDRVSFIHLKDGIPSRILGNLPGYAKGTSLGQGMAPIEEVRRLAIERGLTVVVESEGLDPTGPEEAKRCIDYLKALDARDGI